jgi:glutamine synthetase
MGNGLQPGPPTEPGPGKPEAVLPDTWNAALAAFEESEFIRDYLGRELQTAVSEIKRVEQQEFAGAVSGLEYDSYLVLA